MDERPGELTDAPAAVEEAIRSRRTSLLVDPDAEVPDELVAHLLELAGWAPNHKRTWPWRYTVLAGDARHRFGEALAAVAATDPTRPPAKVAKLPTKYARSNVVVLVWARTDGATEVRRREDRDAVAAAVQTLLLAATSFGLGSYWASLDDELAEVARRFAGLDPDHALVALVYLGWPTGSVAAPPRPPAEVTWLR